MVSELVRWHTLLHKILVRLVQTDPIRFRLSTRLAQSKKDVSPETKEGFAQSYGRSTNSRI